MRFIAKRVADIQSFVVMDILAQAKQMEAAGKDIIHFEIGEPDFPTPQRVIDAGIEILRTGNVKYTPAAGLIALRNAISNHYRERYGIDVSANRIFITPGGSGALLLALATIINPGDKILMADPSYPCNRNFVRFLEGQSVLIPVDSASNFQLTEDLVRINWQRATRGVMIASPSNPTGTIIDSDTQKKLVEEVREKSGILIADEIYHGLEYGQRSTSVLALTDQAFVVNSFSKYFGMTGWRLGWLVAPPELIKPIEKLAQNLYISAPSHSQYAAIAAFHEENIAELERRRLKFKERRDYLFTALSNLGFNLKAKPDGAFYLYCDCSDFSNDSFSFARSLLQSQGVAVTPGKDFGEYCANRYLRFAYTTSMEKIAQAVSRIELFLNAW